MALARLTEAGLSWRTSGRAAITNGRIWFLMIGVLGTASALSAGLAAGSARAAGSRLVAAGPSWLAKVCTLVSVAVVWRERPGQIGDRAADVLLLGGEGAEHLRARVDQRDDLGLLGGERGVQALQRVDQPGQVGPADRDGLVEARQVPVGGLEALEHLGQLVAVTLAGPWPAPLTSRSR